MFRYIAEMHSTYYHSYSAHDLIGFISAQRDPPVHFLPYCLAAHPCLRLVPQACGAFLYESKY